jgi:hypothetical protein
LSVHFNYAVNLMPSLIVFKGEGTPILPPDGIGEAIGVGKEEVVNGDSLSRLHVEEDGVGNVKDVAGFRILSGEVLGLELIGR